MITKQAIRKRGQRPIAPETRAAATLAESREAARDLTIAMGYPVLPRRLETVNAPRVISLDDPEDEAEE